MTDHLWVKEFPGAVTICNVEGIILEMNDAADEFFRDNGGRKLIDTKVLDCHPEAAHAKLQKLMEAQRTNVYTIEKKGVKKLIHQTPWYQDGKFAGLVELALEIPFQMPHFVRGS